MVVLSNNDGFVVARSKEAKALGIGGLQPFFKVEPLLRRNNVAIFSSNYLLYGDLSNRVMSTLKGFSPHIEVYSIDEMFLSLRGMSDQPEQYGRKIKNRLWEHIRMPVGIGMAPTKTLAKMANRAAKRIPAMKGVCLLDKPFKWEWVLRRVPVTAIWGVAERTAMRLADLNIGSAWDLAAADPKLIRRRSSICLERTIEELNGRPCLALEESPADKKQIYCTRSFGRKAEELQPILEAISLYAARAAEKLRAQKYLALAIHVFMHTSPFEPGFHAASDIAKMPYPTDDTRLITALARKTASRLYSPGHAFLKAGIGLIEIVPGKYRQFDMLHPGQPEKSDRIMRVMDEINRNAGKGTLFLAAQGVSKPWYMRQQFTSPQYTTKWSELPVARA